MYLIVDYILILNLYISFRNCERLDNLVLKEPPARRQNWKIKVDQLKNDVRHLQSHFQTSQVRNTEVNDWNWDT